MGFRHVTGSAAVAGVVFLRGRIVEADTLAVESNRYSTRQIAGVEIAGLKNGARLANAEAQRHSGGWSAPSWDGGTRMAAEAVGLVVVHGVVVRRGGARKFWGPFDPAAGVRCLTKMIVFLPVRPVRFDCLVR